MFCWHGEDQKEQDNQWGSGKRQYIKIHAWDDVLPSSHLGCWANFYPWSVPLLKYCAWWSKMPSFCHSRHVSLTITHSVTQISCETRISLKKTKKQMQTGTPTAWLGAYSLPRSALWEKCLPFHLTLLTIRSLQQLIYPMQQRPQLLAHCVLTK